MADKERIANDVKTVGLGLGSCMAMILSWEHNHSILWALGHGICSWGYVIYWAIRFRL